MFLLGAFQHTDPEQRAKTPAAPSPEQILDSLLKSASAMRSWSPEQLRRYTDSLDPVLRAPRGLDPTSAPHISFEERNTRS